MISSSCWNPVGMPVPMPPVDEMRSISSSVPSSSALDGDVVLAAAPLGDVVDLDLGAVDDVVDAADQVVAAGRGVVAHLDDAGAGRDQPAQRRPVGDDLGVVAGVGRRRDQRDQRVQVGRAADADAAVPTAGQLGGDGDGVGRLAAAVEVEDRVVDLLVGGAVEVAGPQHLDDVGDGVLGQHHRAEHGLLGLDGLGRRAVELARAGARPGAAPDLVDHRHALPSR